MPQRTQRKGHRATRLLPHLGARQQATRCPLLYDLYGKFLARSPMGNYKPLTLRVATLHRVLATGYKIATCHHFLYGSQARAKRSRSPSACLGWMINVASLGSPIRAKLDFSSYAFIQKTPFCIIARYLRERPTPWGERAFTWNTFLSLKCSLIIAQRFRLCQALLSSFMPISLFVVSFSHFSLCLA